MGNQTSVPGRFGRGVCRYDTMSIDAPDPECRLCHVPNEARPHPVRVTVSNSFGFGGSNTCLVLRAA